MKFELLAGATCVAMVSALLTHAIRRLAMSHGYLDVPNERSSHHIPTPKGGGAAIVFAATGACALLWLHHGLSTNVFLALSGGLAVAATGFVDDRRSLSPGLRLAVHLIAAVWALAWLGGLPALLVGTELLTFGTSGYVVGALGVIWVLNLFNFMDGIDGIAASEGAFITWAGALVLSLPRADAGDAAAACLVGAACVGFLVWNWPPARIFMGDVGSGYLGYAIAVFALAAARNDPVAVWVWLILGGVFFVDATVTLVRRLARGERVYEAHRTHAYQWLSRRWGSHGRVTLAVLLVDIFWLLPCAVFASLRPPLAAITTLIALAPLVALAISAGSGRPEQPDRTTS
jgi:Fuc2NAc and GlcNAc transferase